MIKETSSNQLSGRDSECKMVSFKSPSIQYSSIIGMDTHVYQLPRIFTALLHVA